MTIKKRYLFFGFFIMLNALAATAENTVNSNSPMPIGTISATSSLIPQAPDLKVKAYVLMDAKSGNIIAAKNPDDELPPASLTKIMSLYLIADALKSGKIALTDQVPISEKAWRTQGSRMFAKVGSTVPIEEMIKGIVIASGNDATVAMAEYIAGTEEAFVDLMNQTAKLLEMRNTHFADSNGLPAANHYSSARDIALLARAWISKFPEYYPWFKTKWITYNNIKQPNRNRLLWRDPSVDGMKTGHTDDSGYCLAASAERNGMRLIAIVLDAPSDRARIRDTEALLNYGFRFFESHKIYAANKALVMPKIWYGKRKTVALGLNDDLYITVPAGQYNKIKINVKISEKLKAPIKKGQKCGIISLNLADKTLDVRPLIALQDNPVGGMWVQFIDRIASFF